MIEFSGEERKSIDSLDIDEISKLILREVGLGGGDEEDFLPQLREIVKVIISSGAEAMQDFIDGQMPRIGAITPNKAVEARQKEWKPEGEET